MTKKFHIEKDFTKKKRTLTDLLQIVVSVVFTRFLALFQVGFSYQSGRFLSDLLVLFPGVGIGTILSMLFVGRVIAVFHKAAKGVLSKLI